MLSGKQLAKTIRFLEKYDFDVILFSGGGNDIVGGEFRQFLRDFKPSYQWRDCINFESFERELSIVESYYRKLIDLRNEYDSQAVVITHGYDHPVPRDAPIKTPFGDIGPWMHPSFVKRGINDPEMTEQIAGYFIDRLYSMLLSLQATQDRFVVIDTVGTLNASEWGDEIHPNRGGFRKISQKFKPIFKDLFPDYVS